MRCLHEADALVVACMAVVVSQVLILAWLFSSVDPFILFTRPKIKMNWHEKITEEVDKRKRMCKLAGMRRYFKPADNVNPYEVGTVDNYKKIFPWASHISDVGKYKDCADIDDFNRNAKGNYYPGAVEEEQCRTVGGKWDGNAINRATRYGKGVCFINEQTQKCGELADADLLRPQDARHMAASEIESRKTSCTANPGCKTQKLGNFSMDCVPQTFEWTKQTMEEAPLTGIENRCATKQMSSNRHEGTFLKILAIKQRQARDDEPRDFKRKFPHLFDYDYESHVKSLYDEDEEKELLSAAQMSVYKLVKKNMKTNQRGMLVWHSTGSGKTCIATGIMNLYQKSGKKIIYLSSSAGIQSNPLLNFQECARKFYSTTDLSKVSFGTFKDFYTKLTLTPDFDLNNCVLIMDEVQNLFAPAPWEVMFHDKLRSEFLEKSSCKLFILSATPGYTVEAIFAILNLIRNPADAPITLAMTESTFKTAIKGLVSFFDMSEDHSAFPHKIEEETRKEPMSLHQYEEYLPAMYAATKNPPDFNALQNKNDYYKKARKLSNTPLNRPPFLSLLEFSPKLKTLMDTLGRFPRHKHYVYSAFFIDLEGGGHGIHAIKNELVERGYTQATVDNVQQPGKRFILATIPPPPDFNKLIELFNSKENARGEKIQILLASNAFNEGLDLKDVRHIHIFEPLVSWAADKQLLGRAIRYCSHANLQQKDWTVSVHRYQSRSPERSTIREVLIEFVGDWSDEQIGEYIMSNNLAQGTRDQNINTIVGHLPLLDVESMIYYQANNRVQTLFKYYKWMKEAAVDCAKFAQFHGNIKCAQ